MKKFIVLLFISTLVIAFIIPSFSFAADTAGTSSSGGIGFPLPSWSGMVAGIVIGLYELLIRYIPTVKNYSILGWIIKFIQAVVPNQNSAGPNHP